MAKKINAFSRTTPMAINDDRQRNGQAQAGGRGSGLAKLMMFVIFTGGLLYGVLSLVQPQYKSVAQLFIENATSGAKASNEDSELVTAEIAALRSKPFITRFIEKNKLANDGDYNGVLARKGPMERVAIMLGISADPAKIPKNQRIRQVFMDKLSIDEGQQPQTINIAIRSSNSQKSARLANDLAGSYINMLRTRSSMQGSSDGNHPQSALISTLRDKIAAGEAKLASLRTDLRDNPPKTSSAEFEQLQDGDEAVTNVQIGKEQLSRLVAQHILARADREEAELRAELVRDMLASTGEINSTRTVLNSGLIQKLLIKRSRMERKVADLEVTLLPSHPQLKRLHREMSALKAQIKTEAQKAVANLEDEAKIAAVRENSLKDSLAQLKNTQENLTMERRAAPVASPAIADGRLKQLDSLQRVVGDDRLKLAAIQATLTAKIERAGSSATPLIKATIITRAVAVNVPVFPKKEPITLLGMLASFCLGLVVLLLGNKKAGNGGNAADRSAFDKAVSSRQATPKRDGLQSA
jgi:tyrosine-protein kinase Etk/Wzc